MIVTVCSDFNSEQALAFHIVICHGVNASPRQASIFSDETRDMPVAALLTCASMATYAVAIESNHSLSIFTSRAGLTD
jgi:hypothetical protein